MFKNNFVKRLLTSIIFLFAITIWIFIGAIYHEEKIVGGSEWPSYVFLLITLLLFWLSLLEIINLRKELNWKIWLKALIFILATIIFLFPFSNETYGPYKLLGIKAEKNVWIFNFVLLLFYVVTFVIICWKYKPFQVNDLMFVLTWTLYLVLTFKAVNFLMLKEHFQIKLGWSSLLYVWVIVIASDVGAYLGGTLLGKHQLAPKISPKKTWEGVIVGFFASVIISMTLIVLLINFTNVKPIPFFDASSNIMPIYFITTCILSMLSPCGDLIFSYLKRNHGVKNFSSILPGHGGILDRFDSFSLVVITTYFICLLCFY